VSGLGIIDAELCRWAGALTAEDLELAYRSPAHPTIKAKPWVVEESGMSWLDRFNCWVAEHPWMAAAVLAGGYLILRRK